MELRRFYFWYKCNIFRYICRPIRFNSGYSFSSGGWWPS